MLILQYCLNIDSSSSYYFSIVTIRFLIQHTVFLLIIVVLILLIIYVNGRNFFYYDVSGIRFCYVSLVQLAQCFPYVFLDNQHLSLLQVRCCTTGTYLSQIIHFHTSRKNAILCFIVILAMFSYVLLEVHLKLNL